jgi:hypothetical protein
MIQELTPEAKAYCTAAIELMDREELVAALENLGIACFDNEPTEDFVASYVDSVEAGDIEFDFGYAGTLSYPHHVKMMWYYIEEVWV